MRAVQWKAALSLDKQVLWEWARLSVYTTAHSCYGTITVLLYGTGIIALRICHAVLSMRGHILWNPSLFAAGLDARVVISSGRH